MLELPKHLVNLVHATIGLDNINMFAIVYMMKTALVNIERIPLIWDLIADSLIQLSACKFQKIRKLAIESLLCLIANGLIIDYGKEIKENFQCKAISSILTFLDNENLENFSLILTNLQNVITVVSFYY